MDVCGRVSSDDTFYERAVFQNQDLKINTGYYHYVEDDKEEEEEEEYVSYKTQLI